MQVCEKNLLFLAGPKSMVVGQLVWVVAPSIPAINTVYIALIHTASQCGY